MLGLPVGLRDGATGIDLGCGSGASTLAAARPGSGQTWIAVEREQLLAGAAGLCFRTCGPDGVGLAVVRARVEDVPGLLREGSADIVIANPPYHEEGSSRPPRGGRSGSFSRGPWPGVAVFARAAAHCLRPGGSFHVLCRPIGLTDLLLACRAFGLHPSELQPVGGTGGDCRLIRCVMVRSERPGMVLRAQLSAEQVMSRAAVARGLSRAEPGAASGG